MNEEMKSMKENDVYDLVPLPEGAKPIGCKWIFKTKRESKGDLERYKVILSLRALHEKKASIIQRLSLWYHRKTLLEL